MSPIKRCTSTRSTRKYQHILVPAHCAGRRHLNALQVGNGRMGMYRGVALSGVAA